MAVILWNIMYLFSMLVWIRVELTIDAHCRLRGMACAILSLQR